MRHRFNHSYFSFEGESSYTYTYTLMIILVLMYLLQVFYLGEFARTFYLHTTDLILGNYFTVFTSLFFHANFWHILSNLFALFLFGRFVEKYLGAVGVICVFIFGGIIANIISSLVAYSFGENFYSVGASSGIAALIILSILLEPIRLQTILGWIIIWSDVIGLFQESTVNHLAHLSGYFSLVILFFFLSLRSRKRVLKGFFINALGLLVLYVVSKYFLLS